MIIYLVGPKIDSNGEWYLILIEDFLSCNICFASRFSPF